MGVGWNVHQENFLANSKVINYLKLRYSLGNPGNQNYDAKLSSSIYMYNTAYSNPFGLAPRWRRGVQQFEVATHGDANFGVDVQFLDSR